MALTQVGGADRGRLLVVLRDRLLREALSMALAALGHRVAEFESAVGALAYIEEGGPCDALVIDSALAGEVADPLARLRAARCVIPVMVLSRPGGTQQAAERWGAVGVIDPSQPVAALAATLSKAVAAGALLSGPGSAPAGLSRGPLSVGPAGGVFWKGSRLDLDETERALLSAMTAEAGTSLTYQRARTVLESLEEVASKGVSSEGAAGAAGAADRVDPERVKTLVRRLRKKFREVDPEFDHIVLVPGRGYCWRESSARPTELV